MSHTPRQRPKSKWRWLGILGTLILCLAILGVSVAAVIVINRTEPTAEQVAATRKSEALVETVTVERGTHRPRLVVLGTVQPAQDITLSPRVSGQVVEVSPEFAPGGMVQEGDLLLRIDPADFENALSISKSEQQQAEASREIELARQRLAKKELSMLEGTIDNPNRPLVLREPQIASIEAEVAAAEAAVERAKLDLARTNVCAPFDAHVLSRSVNVGSQVGPGDELGQLVGLEEYWILAAVPVRSLKWVQFPSPKHQSQPRQSQPRPSARAEGSEGTNGKTVERLETEEPEESSGDLVKDNGTSGSSPVEMVEGEHAAADLANEDSANGSAEDKSIPLTRKGSPVTLRNRDAWGPGVERQAYVSRMIGALDEQTRLARVLITVEDPLGLETDAPPLILDTLIETEIKGRPIENVVRLPREYVRDQNTVWVMKDGQLDIREIEIVFRDDQYAYIREGLESGEEVVTTTLATVAEGVGLRKVDESSTSPESPNEGSE